MLISYNISWMTSGSQVLKSHPYKKRRNLLLFRIFVLFLTDLKYSYQFCWFPIFFVNAYRVWMVLSSFRRVFNFWRSCKEKEAKAFSEPVRQLLDPLFVHLLNCSHSAYLLLFFSFWLELLVEQEDLNSTSEGLLYLFDLLKQEIIFLLVSMQR